jgi:hypothetical protein
MSPLLIAGEPFLWLLRHPCTMKPQTQFLIVVGLLTLVLGGAYYVYSKWNQEPLPVFAATIRRDCAPWDGSAFTVAMPMDGGVIDISIYESPDFNFPKSYSLPDQSGRDGNALLLVPAGVPEALSGRVSFESVAEESPVTGEFDLRTKMGRQFKGKFIAAWDPQPALCG